MKLMKLFVAALAFTVVAQAARPMIKPAGYQVDVVNIPKEITLGVGGMAFLDRVNMLI